MEILDEGFPEAVRAKAEKHFKAGRFFCAESVLRSILDESGNKDHRDLVALASGFATGMGGAGCACGAVVGGIMAIGFFFGRATPGDAKVFDCMKLAHELHDAFRDHHKAVCCRILNKGLKHGSDEQQAMCALRTANAAEMAARIIQREFRKVKESSSEATVELPSA